MPSSKERPPPEPVWCAWCTMGGLEHSWVLSAGTRQSVTSQSISPPTSPPIRNTHTRQLSADARQAVSQSVHQSANQSIDTQHSYQTTVGWHTPISQPVSPSSRNAVHQTLNHHPWSCTRQLIIGGFCQPVSTSFHQPVHQTLNHHPWACTRQLIIDGSCLLAHASRPASPFINQPTSSSAISPQKIKTQTSQLNPQSLSQSIGSVHKCFTHSFAQSTVIYL